MQKKSWYKTTWWMIACCTVLLACHEEKQPNNNKVTVNPPSGVPTQQHALPVGVDKSPMDMGYYPEDYPVLKMQGKAAAVPDARVIYSRPQRNGRVVFGNLVEYGKPWRLGANEATEIEFFKEATIQQKKVPVGRYVMYCIPYEDRWILKLNHDLYTWGLKIDSTQDQFTFEVPVAKTNYPAEYFTMEFQPGAEQVNLVMMWDSARAALPIVFGN